MRKKSKYGMPPPNNRIEFEHNIALVFEEGFQKAESENKRLFPNFVWTIKDDLEKIMSILSSKTIQNWIILTTGIPNQ